MWLFVKLCGNSYEIDLLPTPGAEQIEDERSATYMSDDRLESMTSPQSIMEMGASNKGVLTILTRVGSRAEGMEELGHSSSVGTARNEEKGF